MIPGMTDAIRLVPKAELDAKEELTFRGEVNEEARAMLDKALEMVNSRKVSGIAICLAFEDGSYGRLLPSLTSNMAALIGSVATAQHDLILATLTGGLADEK